MGNLISVPVLPKGDNVKHIYIYIYIYTYINDVFSVSI